MPLKYQQKVISRLDLSRQVPENTRNSFERLRTLYSYGVLCYDIYTLAGDHARLVIEQALRERFLSFYGGTVTLKHSGDGRERPVTADRWEAFQAAVPSSPKWRLTLRSGREPEVTFAGPSRPKPRQDVPA
ncbi:MAG TPA: hypothetical protein VIV12_15955 [Streptosporangiaceae bacterium]